MRDIAYENFTGTDSGTHFHNAPGRRGERREAEATAQGGEK